MTLALLDEAQASGACLARACEIIGVSSRTVERWRSRPQGEDRRVGPHHSPLNALTPAEQTQVLAVLEHPAHRHLSPKQLVPRLADDGIYLASESTMYRLARRAGLRARRRAIARTNVARASAVHRATAPNQVWSWDITYLPTVVRGRFLYLYLVLDVWSRRIVGWQVHEDESADLAASLIRRICDDAPIDPHGLVLHSDNGAPMRGSTMLSTLQRLGVVPSFSRPHVSNDNPYSEALFRTLKQGPTFPSLPFADLDSARRWVTRFVAWYNGEHRHSAIRYVTPDERHFGREVAILQCRHQLYQQARRRRPNRWSRATRNWNPVAAVVLNPERQPQPAAA